SQELRHLRLYLRNRQPCRKTTGFLPPARVDCVFAQCAGQALEGRLLLSAGEAHVHLDLVRIPRRASPRGPTVSEKKVFSHRHASAKRPLQKYQRYSGSAASTPRRIARLRLLEP